jgi:hypothetical protein
MLLLASLLTSLFAGSLGAEENQANGSDSIVTGSISTPLPEFSARPVPLPTNLKLANSPASPAPGIAGIRSQPPKIKPSTPRRPPLLIGLYISYAILQGLDAQATIRALHSTSAHEENPVVAPFAAHPAALIAFKAGVAAGTISALDRLFKAHPRMAMITLAGLNSGYAFVVQHNYRSIPAR